MQSSPRRSFKRQAGYCYPHSCANCRHLGESDYCPTEKLCRKVGWKATGDCCPLWDGDDSVKEIARP